MCFNNDDGYCEMYELRYVKCRKPHKCGGCNRIIPKGEQTTCETWLWEGDWFATYSCDDCRRMILSIADLEISEGCRWHEAWCPLDELQQYLHDRHEPVPLLQGTLDECRQQVSDHWASVLDAAFSKRAAT